MDVNSNRAYCIGELGNSSLSLAGYATCGGLQHISQSGKLIFDLWLQEPCTSQYIKQSNFHRILLRLKQDLPFRASPPYFNPILRVTHLALILYFHHVSRL
jgi:hypothetical protein